MPQEKQTRQPLEFYAKSDKDLWVRAVLLEGQIRVEWQPRYVYNKGYLDTIDANGDVERHVPIFGSHHEQNPYRLAGVIPITNEMIRFCGVQNFEKFVYGIMRHVASMIVHGYGEDPEEVVSWFNDFKEQVSDFIPYLVDGKYKIVGPAMEPFSGSLIGKVISLIYKDGKLESSIEVAENKFVFPLDNNQIITSFIIATIPIG